MGASVSKQTTANIANTKIVNQSTINALTENLNTITQKIVTNVGQSCTSSVSLSQLQEYKNLSATEDIIIRSGQEQIAIINVDCVQKANIAQDLQTEFFNKILDDISSTNDTNLMTMLDTASTNASESAFGGGVALAQSDAINLINKDVHNEFTTNIKKVVSNNVCNEINNQVLQELISKSIADQVQKYDTIQAGKNLTIEATQSQNIQSLVKAFQDANISGKIVNKITSDLGLTVKQDTINKTTDESKVVADTTAKAKGILESLGDMWSSILIPVVICCAVCCCACILICGVFFMTGGQQTLQQGIDTAGDLGSQYASKGEIGSFKKMFDK